MMEGHLSTTIFKRGVEQKCHRLSATVAQVVVGTDLWARNQVFEKLYTFK